MVRRHCGVLVGVVAGQHVYRHLRKRLYFTSDGRISETKLSDLLKTPALFRKASAKLRRHDRVIILASSLTSTFSSLEFSPSVALCTSKASSSMMSLGALETETRQSQNRRRAERDDDGINISSGTARNSRYMRYKMYDRWITCMKQRG